MRKGGLSLREKKAEKILRDVVAGEITSRQAARRLAVPASEVWLLIDKSGLGKRNLTKNELAYLERARQRNEKLIEEFIGSRPSKRSIIRTNVSGFNSYANGEYESRRIARRMNDETKGASVDEIDINAA